MDFSLLHDVVIGRKLVDTYVMSLMHSLKYSLVDVTYSGMHFLYEGSIAISLHQGMKGYYQRTMNNNNIIDTSFNDFIFNSYQLEKICMSIPGDWVICNEYEQLSCLDWSKDKLVLDQWRKEGRDRERFRQMLIDEIRSSELQYPPNLSDSYDCLFSN